MWCPIITCNRRRTTVFVAKTNQNTPNKHQYSCSRRHSPGSTVVDTYFDGYTMKDQPTINKSNKINETSRLSESPSPLCSFHSRSLSFLPPLFNRVSHYWQWRLNHGTNWAIARRRHGNGLFFDLQNGAPKSYCSWTTRVVKPSPPIDQILETRTDMNNTRVMSRVKVKWLRLRFSSKNRSLENSVL